MTVRVASCESCRALTPHSRRRVSASLLRASCLVLLFLPSVWTAAQIAHWLALPTAVAVMLAMVRTHQLREPDVDCERCRWRRQRRDSRRPPWRLRSPYEIG